MSFHGLGQQHISVVRNLLQPFAGRISRIGLFGSRATGTWRDNPDIDLVLYGTLNETDLDHIHTLFDESTLPMQVDVKVYGLIDHSPLKSHIDRVMRPFPEPSEAVSA